ncbi:MAG: D-alanine--D-alanine ligase [Clostridia bacterium]|nr:D-alanine--D-alanine ligase [Clostridia bacterium]
MKILVLMGGLSPERNVSLSSGSLIAEALCKRGHSVLALDLYEGIESPDVEVSSLFSSTYQSKYSVPTGLPDIELIIKEHGGRTDKVGPRVIEACRAADCVFLALHGETGENGQLQAMLDIYNIKYTGSGYAGSMLAMDKDIAKKLLRAEGILTPDWVRIDTTKPYDIKQIISVTGLPAVVKPCSCGSSVGVYMVDTEQELLSAISNAAKYERYVMAEQRIMGRELTCAFFDGKPLPPVEIIPKNGFYDYINKYKQNATTEICPAPIGEQATQKVYDITEKGFSALRLCGYARFDYILDENGDAWCLEANTLPGMTPTSLLPQEAAAVGISYGELCERIALLATRK